MHVPGDGAGALGRFVVGVGMDAENAELIGHPRHGTRAAARSAPLPRLRKEPRQRGVSIGLTSYLTAMWWTGPVASGATPFGVTHQLRIRGP
jgi:hypothetical protein